MRFAAVLAVAILPLSVELTRSAARADKADELIDQAKDLFKEGKQKEALAVAGKAVAADALKGYFFRAGLYVVTRQFKLALADYDQLIKMDPKIAEAYNQRGSVHFQMGHIKESLADFDTFLKLKPKERNGHWKRGISLYYAGRFKEGKKQFEGYEAVDTNDVENAVWHFLCVARAEGVAKARKSMLKIGKDPRVPMMEVYALYSGKVKPEDVLAAAKKVNPKAEPKARTAALRQQLFYAHLYLGLFYEILDNKKLALEHMSKAVKDYGISGYMGDVARVHQEILKKGARG